MVSVIIPVYNQAKELRQCLKSLLSQTYQDFEVIIVNDGSEDEFNEVAQEAQAKFKDRLKILNTFHRGANVARNRGFLESRGEFLLFLDADIEMHPQMLEKMVEALKEQPGASFAYSSHYFGWKKFRLWPFSLERLRQMPYIHTSSLIRREHFPGWDEKIKRLQDWDLWLTMAKEERRGVWIDKFFFIFKPGGTMSRWLPSFAYRWLPFLPAVKAYRQAEQDIKKKHQLI
ncbi:glycosyltransferase family 2 protein [Candidatus Parcubacteria bacterium]|nr:MAG: glycosyltransferase family 2 protein [Candidatus Parcubacteria bacterium]